MFVMFFMDLVLKCVKMCIFSLGRFLVLALQMSISVSNLLYVGTRSQWRKHSNGMMWKNLRRMKIGNSASVVVIGWCGEKDLPWVSFSSSISWGQVTEQASEQACEFPLNRQTAGSSSCCMLESCRTKSVEVSHIKRQYIEDWLVPSRAEAW